NLGREVMHVECAVFFVDFRKANRDSAFFESTPGRNISVVIEMSEQDFIARMKFTCNRAADGVRQRGHVGTKDNFVGSAIEEIGHGTAGFGDGGIEIGSAHVRTASIGIVAVEIAGDGINHTLRDLGAAGAIEKGGGMTVDGLGQRRELGTGPGEVELCGSLSFSYWHNFLQMI